MSIQYPINSKEELIALIQTEIINTKEVVKILGCSRQNLSDLNKSRALVPAKKTSNDTFYFQEDVLKRLKQIVKMV